jgi:hypothetical protein
MDLCQLGQIESMHYNYNYVPLLWVGGGCVWLISSLTGWVTGSHCPVSRGALAVDDEKLDSLLSNSVDCF